MTCEALAGLATHHHLGVAVGESVTGGLLADRLAEAPDAAAWFRGGMMIDDLGPDLPPDATAERLAVTVAEAMGADLGLAMCAGDLGSTVLGVHVGPLTVSATYLQRGGPDRYRVLVDQAVRLLVSTLEVHLGPAARDGGARHDALG